ncbi:MAG TPA: CbiX/SirB N-terminal domain-containing protein [Fibrobacteria bacterium]|nr:CbiX/SirB N-terminal domain-containing protein [Fibrobacteria bacterium]HOX51104.1 CbiX/SirB N-terminal domain-containing protein [Fibrobacteria bacterium]
MKKHVVLFGHGSRASGSDLAIRAVARDLGQRTGWEVLVAHMELAKPSLPEVVRSLVQKGIRSVSVVPYFLHVGIHLREDIPALLDGIRAEHPGLQLVLTEPLGYDPSLAQILEDRVREAAA